MKKVISLTLVLAITLACVGIIACGSKTITYWNDLAVYPGAKQVQKGGWAIPEVEEKWGNVDWSYYQSGDSVSEVSAFYKDHMSAGGWETTGWFDMFGMAYGNFSKNNGSDGAMVWVGSADGKTGIALMRASQ